MSLKKAEILDLICREIYAATYPPEIVARVVKEAGIDLGRHSSDTGMFKNWLDFSTESRLRRRNTMQNPELLTDDIRFILKTVHEQLARAERGIEARWCNYDACRLKMLSERYAIDVRHDQRADFECFVLYDCFHGQRMDLETDEKIPIIPRHSYKLYPVDEEHFFFISYKKYSKHEGRRGRTPACNLREEREIHLVRINLNKFRCEVLDSKFEEKPPIDRYYYKDNRIDYVVKDRKNPHRFYSMEFSIMNLAIELLKLLVEKWFLVKHFRTLLTAYMQKI